MEFTGQSPVCGYSRLSYESADLLQCTGSVATSLHISRGAHKRFMTHGGQNIQAGCR